MGRDRAKRARQALEAKRVKLGLEKKVSPLRCFWTWPFGHVGGPYADAYSKKHLKCVFCQRVFAKPRRPRWGWYDIS